MASNDARKLTTPPATIDDGERVPVRERTPFHSPPNPYDPQQSCDWCKQLHMIWLQNWPQNSPLKEKGARKKIKHKRKLADLLSEVVCPLCLLVKTLLSQELGLPSANKLESLSDSSLEWKDLRYEEDSAFHPSPKAWRPADTGTLRVSLMHRSSLRRQTIYIRRYPCDEKDYPQQTPDYKPREIPPVVDIALIKQWLDLCKTSCSGICAPDPIVPKPNCPIFMIDVNSRKVVPALQGGEGTTTDYAALSYVWGSPEVPQLRNTLEGGVRSRLMEPGGLADLHIDIPTTLKDAMQLCQLLGISYLWADALCLDQDDSGHDYGQFDFMGEIYKGAHLTIIAGAGEDSWAGLPGVREGTRVRRQHLANVEGMLLGNKKTSSKNHLSRSRWITRGWTLQEMVLSKRVLIFTKDEIAYDCRAGSGRCESMHLEHLPPWRVPDTMGEVEWGRNYMELGATNSAYDTFRQLMRQYRGRRITHDSDTLRAFSGILNDLNTTWGLTFFAGLPLQYFDCAIGFTTVSQNPNPEFPSWSWAAWGLKLASPFPLLEETHQMVLWYRLSKRSPSGALTFQAIPPSKPEAAQALMSVSDLELEIDAPPAWIPKIENMLLVEAESISLPITRHSLSLTYKAQWPGPDRDDMGFAWTIDVVSAPGTEYPDVVEFVRIARSGRPDSIGDEVILLLLHTHPDGTSYRVGRTAFAGYLWDRAKLPRKRFFLC
ncbi:HET-domain-containing protein [Lophium mytilinum]|uniref:HET-domain-containing protein n=1 Tax=Lophium mytilinum TaxID=390894 RepID=A0A6A6QHE5_9PEZI|nr:HET-domain-containing protein [Lophium mytilinum]